MFCDAISEMDPPTVYQIRIKGHLAPHWAESFAGMRMTQVANGETLLTGPVADQAALHGLLRKVRNLGVPLVSVARLDDGPAAGQVDVNDCERKEQA